LHTILTQQQTKCYPTTLTVESQNGRERGRVDTVELDFGI